MSFPRKWPLQQKLEHSTITAVTERQRPPNPARVPSSHRSFKKKSKQQNKEQTKSGAMMGGRQTMGFDRLERSFQCGDVEFPTLTWSFPRWHKYRFAVKQTGLACDEKRCSTLRDN